MTPDRLQALRAQHQTGMAPSARRALADEMFAEIDRLAAERDQLRQHILDIDAHATPYGDIPNDPGYVGTYLLTAGALHRALGKIGHTAPKCEAEAQLAAVEQDRDKLSDELAKATVENNCYRHALRHILSRVILAPLALEYSLKSIETKARHALALEVLDLSVPPGGYVCAICRTPVESEPCPDHGKRPIRVGAS